MVFVYLLFTKKGRETMKKIFAVLCLTILGLYVYNTLTMRALENGAHKTARQAARAYSAGDRAVREGAREWSAKQDR
jgi:hypothetical protein